MTKKEEIIMTLLCELERTITTIMDVLNQLDKDAEPAKGKWIPAELFQPELYRRVLVSNADGEVSEDFLVKYRNSRNELLTRWNDHEDDDVTAWMFMPKGIKRDE